ncbi:MAG: hypothetical protein Q4G25_10510 [Paracoccus sp. (in: a-proteobacteria)]|nr:hypothetical protein [Paracoccus sp. (in: a-proteobacteria)]
MTRFTLAFALSCMPGLAAALDAGVISTVTFDLIPDRAGLETATITQNPGIDSAGDLTITAADGTVILSAPEATTAGSFAGDPPSVAVAPNGSSLYINQEWTGVGRNPWSSTTTVAWRDGALLVAGETTRMYDRITNETLSCDWNLLSGGYEVQACALRDPDQDAPGDCVERQDTGSRPARVTLAQWLGGDTAGLESFCTLR